MENQNNISFAVTKKKDSVNSCQSSGAKPVMKCYLCGCPSVSSTEEFEDFRNKFDTDAQDMHSRLCMDGIPPELHTEKKIFVFPFISLDDIENSAYWLSEFECRVCGSNVGQYGSDRKKHVEKSHLCRGIKDEGESEKVDCFFKSCGCKWRGFPGLGERQHFERECIYAKLILCGLFSSEELKSLEIMNSDSPLLDLKWSVMDHCVLAEAVNLSAGVQIIMSDDLTGDDSEFAVFDTAWNEIIFRGKEESRELLDMPNQAAANERDLMEMQNIADQKLRGRDLKTTENALSITSPSPEHDKLVLDILYGLTGYVKSFDNVDDYRNENKRFLLSTKPVVNASVRDHLLRRSIPDMVWMLRYGGHSVRSHIGFAIIQTLQKVSESEEGRRVLIECKMSDVLLYFFNSVPYATNRAATNRADQSIEKKFGLVGEIKMWTGINSITARAMSWCAGGGKQVQLLQAQMAFYNKNKKAFTFYVSFMNFEAVYRALGTLLLDCFVDVPNKVLDTFLEIMEDALRQYSKHVMVVPEPVETKSLSTEIDSIYAVSNLVCRAIKHFSPEIIEKILSQKPKILDFLFDMCYLRDRVGLVYETLCVLSRFEKENSTSFVLTALLQRNRAGKKNKNIGWIRTESETGERILVTGKKYGRYLGIIEQIIWYYVERDDFDTDDNDSLNFLSSCYSSVGKADIADSCNCFLNKSKKKSKNQKRLELEIECMNQLAQLDFCKELRKKSVFYRQEECCSGFIKRLSDGDIATSNSFVIELDEFFSGRSIVFAAFLDKIAICDVMLTDSLWMLQSYNKADRFSWCRSEIHSILNEGLLMLVTSWAALLLHLNPARNDTYFDAIVGSIVAESDREFCLALKFVTFDPDHIKSMLCSANRILKRCETYCTQELSKLLATRKQCGDCAISARASQLLKESPLFAMALLYDSLINLVDKAFVDQSVMFDGIDWSDQSVRLSKKLKKASLKRQSSCYVDIHTNKRLISQYIRKKEEVDENDAINIPSAVQVTPPVHAVDKRHFPERGSIAGKNAETSPHTKRSACGEKVLARSDYKALTIAPHRSSFNLEDLQLSKSSTGSFANSSTHESESDTASPADVNSGLCSQEDEKNAIEEPKNEKRRSEVEEDDIQIIPVFNPWVDETGLFEWEAGGITLTLAVSGRE